jgi:hypothetical protein
MPCDRLKIILITNPDIKIMSRTNTAAKLTSILKGTCLSNTKIIELEIPESGDRALAIQIDPSNAI